MRIRLVQLPNILSVCWILVCIKMLLMDEVANRGTIDYILYFLLVSYLICELFYRRLKGKKLEAFIEWMLLITIGVLGVVQNPSIYAITSVIGLVVVMSMILNCGFGCMEIQHFYIVIPYILVLFLSLLKTIKGELLGNTVSGAICFLSCGFIVSIVNNQKDGKGIKRKIINFIDTIAILTSILLVVFVGFEAAARTTLLTTVTVICACFLLRVLKPNPKQGKRLFWIIVLITGILTFAYIFVSSFKWYELLNAYSQAAFDKNINSSRPYLWSYSLTSLSLWEIFFGKGTGMLPTITRYASSSFHNSFIQIIMQNGIVGLALFVFILRSLWNIIADNCDDKVCSMVLAMFIGIVVYNSFETTLLQNKIFVGICEWMVICMGIIRSKNVSRH